MATQRVPALRIAKDFKDGVSVFGLAAVYQLSIHQIEQILRRFVRPEGRTR